jgi:hypothetical protein
LSWAFFDGWESIFTLDILLSWERRNLTTAATARAYAVGSGGSDEIFFIVGGRFSPGMLLFCFRSDVGVDHKISLIAFELDIIFDISGGEVRDILNSMLASVVVVQASLGVLFAFATGSGLFFIHESEGIGGRRARSDTIGTCIAVSAGCVERGWIELVWFIVAFLGGGFADTLCLVKIFE